MSYRIIWAPVKRWVGPFPKEKRKKALGGTRPMAVAVAYLAAGRHARTHDVYGDVDPGQAKPSGGRRARGAASQQVRRRRCRRVPPGNPAGGGVRVSFTARAGSWGGITVINLIHEHRWIISHQALSR